MTRHLFDQRPKLDGRQRRMTGCVHVVSYEHAFLDVTDMAFQTQLGLLSRWGQITHALRRLLSGRKPTPLLRRRQAAMQIDPCSGALGFLVAVVAADARGIHFFLGGKGNLARRTLAALLAALSAAWLLARSEGEIS